MNGVHYESFPTIDSIVERLDQATNVHQHSRVDSSESWDLNLGYDGAIAAYSGGWSEGAQRAYELAETIKLAPRAPRTALRRNVTGAFPNVGAYLAGSPLSMYQVSQKEAHDRPFVHLYMQINYLSNISAETAFDRGCALVALADALEESGCRVKITGVDNTKPTSGIIYCAFHELKDYADRLDVDNLIFTVAHPAYYRRICFALRERSTRKSCRKGWRSIPLDVNGLEIEEDNVHVVVFPLLEDKGVRDNPEMYLKDMINVLPDDIKEWIGE